MKTYTTSRNLYGTLSNNTSTANLTLGDQMINDSTRYLIQKFNLDERTKDITLTTAQFHDLPYNYKKLINVTVTVGTYKYSPRLISSRQEWDNLTMTSSVSSNIPQYYYIFNGQLGLYPIQSSAGNTMTYVYKIRTRDLSQADYTTGTVTVTNGSTTVTGSGTTFIKDMAGRWLQVTAPSGDNEWYKIASWTSTTVLTLENAYNGDTVSGASYIIGEVSILEEDYQDLPIYNALMKYYSSRVTERQTFEMYRDLYNEGFALMNAQLGSKETNPVMDYGDDEIDDLTINY